VNFRFEGAYFDQFVNSDLDPDKQPPKRLFPADQDQDCLEVRTRLHAVTRGSCGAPTRAQDVFAAETGLHHQTSHQRPPARAAEPIWSRRLDLGIFHRTL